jgi:hypothetical protein
MDLSQHTVLSAAGSGLIYWGTRDIQAAAAFGLTGIFIDLDHLADYLYETGFNTDLKRFMKYHSSRGPRHLWLWLHSWEAVLVCLLAAWLAQGNQLLLFGGLGWLFHMLIDQFSNRLHPLAYFLWFRVQNKFIPEKIYGDK